MGWGGTSAANVHYFRSDIFLTTLFLTLGETIKTASEFHALYFTLSWHSDAVLQTKLCVYPTTSDSCPNILKLFLPLIIIRATSLFDSSINLGGKRLTASIVLYYFPSTLIHRHLFTFRLTGRPFFLAVSHNLSEVVATSLSVQHLFPPPLLLAASCPAEVDDKLSVGDENAFSWFNWK